MEAVNLQSKSVDPVLSSRAAALHETAGCLGLWCGHLMLIVSDVVELPEPGSKEKTVWVLPEVWCPPSSTTLGIKPLTHEYMGDTRSDCWTVPLAPEADDHLTVKTFIPF